MVVNTNKMIRNMKILLIILLTIAIGCGAAVAIYLKNIWDNPTKAFGGNANFVVTDESGITHEYNKGIITFLVVGLDSDSEREDANKGYRSDTIMVCVVDTDKNQASLVSIPRDTKARVQVLNAQGKPTRMVTTKINAAFSYGFSPDKYGYQNTMDAVNTLFNSTGVNIDPIKYFVGADMDDFVAIANKLGGVDLQLEQDVPGFGSEGEWIHLEGEKALDYVRIRKGKGLTGMDTDRTTRQRGFIKAMAVKMQQLGGRETIIKLYNECVNEGIVDTNLTLEHIYALAGSVEEIDLESVMFEMMPGYINDKEGEGYWHVNKTQLKQMILDLFYNAQTNGLPTAQRTTEITTADKSDDDDDYSTKTQYTYTKKTTKKTTEKTSKKTSSKSTSGSKSSSKKTESSSKNPSSSSTKPSSSSSSSTTGSTADSNAQSE